MKLHYDTATDKLHVVLDGEIDHHSSGKLRSEVDAAIYMHTPKTLVLDFRDVTFMDSSGIGLIMGRHKILQPMGGDIILLRPAPHIRRILKVAGMERLAKIRSQLKQEVSP